MNCRTASGSNCHADLLSLPRWAIGNSRYLAIHRSSVSRSTPRSRASWRLLTRGKALHPYTRGCGGLHQRQCKPNFQGAKSASYRARELPVVDHLARKDPQASGARLTPPPRAPRRHGDQRRRRRPRAPRARGACVWCLLVFAHLAPSTRGRLLRPSAAPSPAGTPGPRPPRHAGRSGNAGGATGIGRVR